MPNSGPLKKKHSGPDLQIPPGRVTIRLLLRSRALPPAGPLRICGAAAGFPLPSGSSSCAFVPRKAKPKGCRRTVTLETGEERGLLFFRSDDALHAPSIAAGGRRESQIPWETVGGLWPGVRQRA